MQGVGVQRYVKPNKTKRFRNMEELSFFPIFRAFNRLMPAFKCGFSGIVIDRGNENSVNFANSFNFVKVFPEADCKTCHIRSTESSCLNKFGTVNL